MNFLRSKCIQKLSTSFLIVLLLFIHTAKAFHTHNYSLKNVTATSYQSVCPICDFQLAKDADATISVAVITTPVTFIQVYHYYTLQQPVSFSITSSVRGPPYFVC